MDALKDSTQLKYWKQYLQYIRNKTHSFVLFLETESHHISLDGLELTLQTGLGVVCAAMHHPEFTVLPKTF